MEAVPGAPALTPQPMWLMILEASLLGFPHDTCIWFSALFSPLIWASSFASGEYLTFYGENPFSCPSHSPSHCPYLSKGGREEIRFCDKVNWRKSKKKSLDEYQDQEYVLYRLKTLWLEKAFLSPHIVDVVYSVIILILWKCNAFTICVKWELLKSSYIKICRWHCFTDTISKSNILKNVPFYYKYKLKGQ